MDVNDYAPFFPGGNPADWLSDAAATGVRRRLRGWDIHGAARRMFLWERLQSLVPFWGLAPSWGRCFIFYAPSERGIPAEFSLASRHSSPLRFSTAEWLVRQGPSDFARFGSFCPACGDILSCSTRHPWRASYFLLFGQEKVSKEKATPTLAPYAQSLCYGFASLLRGSPTVHPWTGVELAHVVWATLRADPPQSRRDRGAPCSARRARLSQSQKPPRQLLLALLYLLHPCSRHPPCRAPSPVAREKETSEQSRSVRESASSWLRTMRSEWAPYVAATWRRDSPQGGRKGLRPVRRQSRDGLSANPWSRVAQSEGRMPEDRCIGVAFLWAMFLYFGLLPYALRASYAVRAAPAAQWPHKERWLARLRRVKNGMDAALRRSVKRQASPPRGDKRLKPLPRIACIAIKVRLLFVTTELELPKTSVERRHLSRDRKSHKTNKHLNTPKPTATSPPNIEANHLTS